MIGKQHKIMTASLSILAVTIMCHVYAFSLLYIGIIPISVYFSTFPDIDQAMAVPKQWRAIKQVFLFVIPTVFFLAVGIFIYAMYQYMTDLSIGSSGLYLKSIVVSLCVIFFYVIAYVYIRVDGKFLLAHRGFTHTLVVPAILLFLFISIAEYDSTLIKIIAALILAVDIGWTAHIVEDMFCKAGVPLLWPLSKSSISVGWAITSAGPKAPIGSAHISSWIYTVIISLVGLLIAALVYLYV